MGGRCLDGLVAARIDGLRAALAVLGVVALLATRKLPTAPVGGSGEPVTQHSV